VNKIIHLTDHSSFDTERVSDVIRRLIKHVALIVVLNSASMSS